MKQFFKIPKSQLSLCGMISYHTCTWWYDNNEVLKSCYNFNIHRTDHLICKEWQRGISPHFLSLVLISNMLISMILRHVKFHISFIRYKMYKLLLPNCIPNFNLEYMYILPPLWGIIFQFRRYDPTSYWWGMILSFFFSFCKVWSHGTFHLWCMILPFNGEVLKGMISFIIFEACKTSHTICKVQLPLTS